MGLITLTNHIYVHVAQLHKLTNGNAVLFLTRSYEIIEQYITEILIIYYVK